MSDASSIVDLTHTLFEGFPVWPGEPGFTMHAVGDSAAHAPTESDTADAADKTAPAGPGGPDGASDAVEFFVHTLHFGEHTGTHIDAPAHVVRGGGTVEQIPVADLVATIVVIEISERALRDPDTTLTVEDVAGWEAAHGRIPPRALVVLHSGWARHVDSPAGMLGADADGVMHFPGFSGPTVRFLVDERDIVAIGTDALSIDAGRSTDFPAHRTILGSGLYAVELLAQLDAIPPTGATAVVAPIKHRGGTGGPARVLAFLPPDEPAADADAP